MNQPYILSLLYFLPIQDTTEDYAEFPVLFSMFSLVIYFMQSIKSIYVSIPISLLFSMETIILSQF